MQELYGLGANEGVVISKKSMREADVFKENERVPGYSSRIRRR